MTSPRRLSLIPLRLACLAIFLAAAWPLLVSAAPPSQPVAPGPVLLVPAMAVPVEVAVTLPDGSRFSKPGACQLVELAGGGAVLDAQIVPAVASDGNASKKCGRLLAVVPPRKGAKGTRRFHLQAVKLAPPDAFTLKEISDASLELSEGGKPVFVYNHGTITREEIPKTEHRRSRACYVHPLFGLRGEVLTDDFPRDHYHHHGIFWTWPHVKVDGREHDLWAGNSIHQKFVRWMVRQTGPVAGVLGVENGWFVGKKKVMVERVWLRAYRAVEGNQRALDVQLVFIPTDRPVTLWGAGGKSYGGLTVRFHPPSKKEALITVPSGPTDKDLPETKLEWADFTATFSGAKQPSGAAVMVSPQHPDYPPTWLTRHYGPLCVGWPGVKARTFQPGEIIRMNYRLWIHKDAAGVESLKAAYAAYTAAVEQPKWQGP